MMKKLSTNFTNHLCTGATIIAFSAISFVPAIAQDGKLVITTSSAEAIKSESNLNLSGLSADGKIIHDLETGHLTAGVEPRVESYSDETLSTYNFETPDYSTLSLGILNNGADASDGVTRRNPYSVENVEIDPLYPEGIYVDSMRATAGIGISSKF